MNSTENLRRSHSASHSSETSIEESHHAGPFSAAGRHDGHLRSRVDERFHGYAVDFRVDVEHVDGAERFWVVLIRGGVVLVDGFHSDRFLDSALRFDVVRIRVVEVVLTRLLLLPEDLLPRQELSEESCETSRIRFCGGGQLGLFSLEGGELLRISQESSADRLDVGVGVPASLRISLPTWE